MVPEKSYISDGTIEQHYLHKFGKHLQSQLCFFPFKKQLN